MNYKSYQRSRDAAWQLLIDAGADQLPINLNIICEKLGVNVYTYQRAESILSKTGLTKLTQDTDGMTFLIGEKPIIMYDPIRYAPRIRFTIAHELGHLILGHVSKGQCTVMNREPAPNDAPEEMAANQFATRLLAPACVLWGLNLHSAEEIADVCQISHQAAAFRAERMAILYERGKFLTSPLERQVYSQFGPFIKEFLRTQGADHPRR